ncbi:MAG: helix-turn-helix transcriptional regulator, partial [Promethearchaeota archaeon]
MPRFNKKLVSRIKELREEQKISQQELAKSVGVSRQTIYY